RASLSRYVLVPHPRRALTIGGPEAFGCYNPSSLLHMSSSVLLPNPSLREFRAHYQALASVTRLRILHFLAGIPEITVQELADAIGVRQQRLRWHLRRLRP